MKMHRLYRGLSRISASVWEIRPVVACLWHAASRHVIGKIYDAYP